MGDNGAAACSKAKAGSLRSSEMEDFILSIRGVYICIDATKSDGTRWSDRSRGSWFLGNSSYDQFCVSLHSEKERFLIRLDQWNKILERWRIVIKI